MDGYTETDAVIIYSTYYIPVIEHGLSLSLSLSSLSLSLSLSLSFSFSFLPRASNYIPYINSGWAENAGKWQSMWEKQLPDGHHEGFCVLL